MIRELIDYATMVHASDDALSALVTQTLAPYFKQEQNKVFCACKLDDAVYAKASCNRSLIQNAVDQRQRAFVSCVATRTLSAIPSRRSSRRSTNAMNTSESFAKRNKFELPDADSRRRFEAYSQVLTRGTLRQIARNRYLIPTLRRPTWS